MFCSRTQEKARTPVRGLASPVVGEGEVAGGGPKIDGRPRRAPLVWPLPRGGDPSAFPTDVPALERSFMSLSKRPDRRLVRTDDSWLTLPNPADVPVEICAGPEVPIESAAIDELLTVLETARTLSDLAAAT